MENNERDRKLDQWLDEALSQYSAAEPRIGLEQRVLAHVRAEEEARAGRRSWWRWMPAFAAIAAVLVVAVAVRPYWEKKVSQRQEETTGALGPKTESTEKASVEPEKKAPATNQAVAESPTPSRTKGTEPRAIAKSRPDANEVAAKDTQRESAERATLYENPAADAVASRTSVVQGGAAGGVVGGIVSNAPIMAAAPAAAPPPATPKAASAGQMQALQVESAAATAETQNMIATEKVTDWPKASKKVDALAKKMKSQPKTEPYDGTINVMGVNVRFNSNGSGTQQFPTPTPLSKQEKLALAAPHQIRDKSSNEAIAGKSDEEFKPLEIKKIEIAPLPGPEK